MRHLLFLTLALLSAAAAAIASERQEIAKCAAEESDATRLICYDALADSLGVARPETTTTSGSGKWSVRTERSPIDDSVNVYMSVRAEDVVKSGYETVRPSVVVRCAENETNVFLNWGLYLGLESTQMLTRFDSTNATTDLWSISTDNKAVFVRGSDVAFAKKMMKHRKLLAQITPYGESPAMAVFDISGLTEAIKPLREACGW